MQEETRASPAQRLPWRQPALPFPALVSLASSWPTDSRPLQRQAPATPSRQRGRILAYQRGTDPFLILARIMTAIEHDGQCIELAESRHRRWMRPAFRAA